MLVTIPNSSSKSENALASSHVLRFLFETELQFIMAQVQCEIDATKYRYMLRGWLDQVARKVTRGWLQLPHDLPNSFVSC